MGVECEIERIREEKVGDLAYQELVPQVFFSPNSEVRLSLSFI